MSELSGVLTLAHRDFIKLLRDRTRIVHALFESGELLDGNGVRQTSSPLVEHDETPERSEAPQEMGKLRILPGVLDVRNETWDQHYV